MARIKAGDLDRVVQFLRGAVSDDGFSQVKTFAPHGGTLRARKIEASDAERWRAAQVQATISARFVVRRSGFTADLSVQDRLICEGVEYEITGRRELAADPKRFFEFSATAEVS
jgi:hypothetical protein